MISRVQIYNLCLYSFENTQFVFWGPGPVLVSWSWLLDLTVLIIQMAECENSLKWMTLKHSFDLYSKLLPLSSFTSNCLFTEHSCSLWRKAGTTELCQTSQVRAKAFVDFALSSCDSVKVNRLVVLGPTQWFGQWTLCWTIITSYSGPTSRCLLVVISLKFLFHLQILISWHSSVRYLLAQSNTVILLSKNER